MSGQPRAVLPLSRQAAGAALVLAGLALALWLVTEHLALPAQVLGPSMKPALAAGDRVLVDRWSYRQRAPRQGEIALLIGPDSLPLVKRVAPAIPGVPYRPGLWNGEPAAGAVWVLGDNRSMSSDSRTFGPVPRRRFLGRVFWRIWPPSRIGPVS